MKGALLKDYYTVKNYAFIFLILPLFLLYGIGIALSEDGSIELGLDQFRIIPIFAAVISVLIVLTAVSADERCGWINNGFTQPMSRKDYMKEKYIFALLTAAAAEGAAIVCDIIGLIVLRGRYDVYYAFLILRMIPLSALLLLFSSVWIITIGICFGIKKLSYVFSVFWVLCILGVGVLMHSLFSDSTSTTATNVLEAAVMLITVYVFIRGWKWIEEKDV